MPELSGGALEVAESRYFLDTETKWSELAHRQGQVIGANESQETQEEFERIIFDQLFIPGGRILRNAGRKAGSMMNCAVLPITDSREGIGQLYKELLILWGTGSGCGVNFTPLRYKGAPIHGVGGKSSGLLSFLKVADSIGSLIESGGCFAEGTLILTDRGYLPIEEIFNKKIECRVSTYNGFKDIKYRFNNGLKDCFKVKTKKGYEVSVTEDHKFKIFNQFGGLDNKRLKDLKVGDRINILINKTNLQNITKLKTEFFYDIKKGCTTLNTDITLPYELNTSLSYLLGFSFGNGNVRMNKCLSLSTCSDNTLIIDKLVNIVREIFSLEPTLRKGDGNVTNIDIYSRMLIEYLRENNLLKQKALDITMPYKILNSSDSNLSSFIAGYFDADGYNSKTKAGYSIKSVSEKFLYSIQLSLLRLGIPCRVLLSREENGNWNDLFMLSVTGRVIIDRFNEIIGEYSCKCSKQNHKFDFSFRYNNFDPKTLGIRYKYFREKWTPNKNGNRNVGISYSGFYDILNNNTELYNKYNNLLNLVEDEIEFIEYDGKRSTYDLEIEDCHALSGNGIYTSNSRRSAGLALVHIDHPEVEDVINAKLRDGEISNFNISIGITREFLDAVRREKPFYLRFGAYKKEVDAKDLWYRILSNMLNNGEPGVIYLDNFRKNNSFYFSPPISVNPCITGDTKILVYNEWSPSQPITVSFNELAKTGCNVLVYSFNNKTKEIEIKKMVNPRLTGVMKPIVRVCYKDGTSFKCTPDHKILTSNGYIPIQDIAGNGYYYCPISGDPKLFRLEDAGYDNVYNGTVDDNHNYLIVDEDHIGRKNVIISRNCGEQILGPHESCDLGSINLTKFITSGGSIRWAELKSTIRTAVRFLDNVLDINRFDIKEMAEAAANARRIGLGTLGLADLLFHKELRYGSVESIDFIERLYKFIRDEAYIASVDLAKERGSFTKFDRFHYLDASFIRKLPVKLRLYIEENGIRNTCILTQPPTGTTSLIAGVTSGIEPLISKAHYRHDRISKRSYIHPIYKDILLNNKPTPDWYVDSYDLTPEDHLETQVAITKYNDSGTSKTINIPNKMDVEEFDKIIREYIQQIKGVTVYREGSRENQILTPMSREEAEEELRKEKVDSEISEEMVQCATGACEI